MDKGNVKIHSKNGTDFTIVDVFFVPYYFFGIC